MPHDVVPSHKHRKTCGSLSGLWWVSWSQLDWLWSCYNWLQQYWAQKLNVSQVSHFDHYVMTLQESVCIWMLDKEKIELEFLINMMCLKNTISNGPNVQMTLNRVIWICKDQPTKIIATCTTKPFCWSAYSIFSLQKERHFKRVFILIGIYPFTSFGLII